jgi:hypothetical protein
VVDLVADIHAAKSVSLGIARQVEANRVEPVLHMQIATRHRLTTCEHD